MIILGFLVYATIKLCWGLNEFEQVAVVALFWAELVVVSNEKHKLKRAMQQFDASLDAVREELDERESKK